MSARLAIVLIGVATLLHGVDGPSSESLADPCGTSRRGDDGAPAVASSTASGGSGDACREEIDELVESLLGWIDLHTDYDVAPIREHPPAVSFVSRGEQVGYEGEELVIEGRLRALYDGSTRRIYLVQPWNIEDVVDRSVLLHEIVHHVQLSSRHWYCPQATEWESYKLQDAWLAEHGLASGFDWLHVYFLSRCSRDFHP